MGLILLVVPLDAPVPQRTGAPFETSVVSIVGFERAGWGGGAA